MGKPSNQRMRLTSLLLTLVAVGFIPGTAHSYSYATWTDWGDRSCNDEPRGQIAVADTYCTALSNSTSVRLCCMGTEFRAAEAMWMFYDNSRECTMGGRFQGSLIGGQDLGTLMVHNRCNSLPLYFGQQYPRIYIRPGLMCSSNNEPFVLMIDNATFGTTQSQPSGQCSWTSTTSSRKRTCTGPTSLRVDDYSNTNCSDSPTSALMVTAPYVDGALTWNCRAFTYTNLPHCSVPDRIRPTAQGYLQLPQQRSGYGYNFPDRQIGSEPRPFPTMSSNLHLNQKGSISAKETAPDEHSSPWPIYNRHDRMNEECEDRLPTSQCKIFAATYGCSSCCIGGKGEGINGQMSVADACPSQCSSNCTLHAYNDLMPMTKKQMGIEMWEPEEDYPNP